MQQAVRDALIAFMAVSAQAQAEATESAQRAGIDRSRMVKPSADLERTPSYVRAHQACYASPPSLTRANIDKPPNPMIVLQRAELMAVCWAGASWDMYRDYMRGKDK